MTKRTETSTSGGVNMRRPLTMSQGSLTLTHTTRTNIHVPVPWYGVVDATSMHLGAWLRSVEGIGMARGWHYNKLSLSSALLLSFLKKHLNASRPSEHPPVRGENVKTFRWDHRPQIQNLFMAFKRVPLW